MNLFRRSNAEFRGAKIQRYGDTEIRTRWVGGGEGGGHSARKIAQCHKCLDFTPENPKTWVCRKKMLQVTNGGALKLISPLGLLTNLKVFCCVSYGIYRDFFIFYLKKLIIRVCWQIFSQFFQKLNFWKKVKILIFPKNREKFKISKK